MIPISSPPTPPPQNLSLPPTHPTHSALTRAHDIHTQLTKQMQRAGFALLSHDATSGGGGGGGGDAARSGVLRALVAGLFPHAAQRTMEGVCSVGVCMCFCVDVVCVYMYLCVIICAIPPHHRQLQGHRHWANSAHPSLIRVVWQGSCMHNLL